jgi:hypothetical protein
VLRHLLTTLALCAAATAPATAQLALSTTFNGNNNGGVGGTFYFDLTVKQKTTLYALDCNFTATQGSSVGIEFWMTSDTRVGKQLDPNVWILMPGAGANATAAGPGQPTRVNLLEPLNLQPGSYGIALITIGTGHRYGNGTETYSDGFLELETGEAANGPFRGPLLQPHVWNGRLIYGPKTLKGPYVYAYDDRAGALHAFLLDKKTGAPGQLLGSPFDVSGGGVDVDGNGQTLTSDAKGTFLFASTDDGLAVLRRLPGGAVETVAGSPFAGSSDLAGVKAWESGSALFVLAVARSAGVLDVFAIDRETGAASLRSGSASIGALDGGVGITAGKRFVYVANEQDGQIRGFAIDASGALTPIPNSPFSFAGIEEPSNLVLNAKETVLAVNDCDDGDFLFATIDRTTGALILPVVLPSASSCSNVFGFTSKGTFYGGGDNVIDAFASGPTLLGSPTMPGGTIDLGLVTPKGTSIYYIDGVSLHHTPIDKRLLLPIASETATLFAIFNRQPSGMVYLAK